MRPHPTWLPRPTLATLLLTGVPHLQTVALCLNEATVDEIMVIIGAPWPPDTTSSKRYRHRLGRTAEDGAGLGKVLL